MKLKTSAMKFTLESKSNNDVDLINNYSFRRAISKGEVEKMQRTQNKTQFISVDTDRN